MNIAPKNTNVIHSMRKRIESKLHLMVLVQTKELIEHVHWDLIKSYSEIRSSKITPANAHHPNDKRCMLGIDSTKNNVMMNIKTRPVFWSSRLSFIGY